MRGTLHKWFSGTFLFMAMLVGFEATAPSATAQLLYSFESDLQGWANTGFTGSGASDLISVTQSTEGFTHGTHSMAVETGNAISPDTSAFGWDVNRTVTPVALPDVYNAFNAAAGDPTKYTLDFDITTTANSFANVAATGPFFLINVALSSDDGAGNGGFDQVFNVTPNLIGVDGSNWVPLPPNTYHVSIPFGEIIGDSGSLYAAPGANYYQLNIGSNKNNTLFMNGSGNRGAIYFVDNIEIVEKPDVVEETIFSWETPDNPGTPAVNEQLEGWTTGFHVGHAHSLVATGATHGNTALQIDRTSLESGFAWGSQFQISSDTNADPEVEEIDPTLQATIDQLVDKIVGAQSVAFDVTYQYTDQFPAAAPTFTKFAVHFSDETGVFYQAEQSGFISIPSGTPETTTTIEIPLSLFLTGSGDSLLEDGFVEGTSYLRIGLATNTDGGQIYQIDNFRLISLAPLDGLPGDYNDDGKVDAADYVVWRKNQGTNNTLPNDPDGGMIGASQYNTWRANFGIMPGGGSSAANTAVPEPGSMMLLLCAAVAVSLVRGRRK